MAIEFTDKARDKAIELRKAENFTIVPNLRVGVKGGGCSGLRYDLFFDDDPAEDTDEAFVFGELTVVVDHMSMQYLDGITIDYVDSLAGAGFKFNNPKVSKSCGCGSSFAV